MTSSVRDICTIVTWPGPDVEEPENMPKRLIVFGEIVDKPYLTLVEVEELVLRQIDCFSQKVDSVLSDPPQYLNIIVYSENIVLVHNTINDLYSVCTPPSWEDGYAVAV